MLRMRLADGLIESLARQRYGCGIPPYMRESARPVSYTHLLPVILLKFRRNGTEGLSRIGG